MLQLIPSHVHMKHPLKPNPGFLLGIPHWDHRNGVFNMNQWPFQEPKLEVPTTYKAYIRPM